MLAVTLGLAFGSSCFIGIEGADIEEGDVVVPNVQPTVFHTWGSAEVTLYRASEDGDVPVDLLPREEGESSFTVVRPVEDLEPGWYRLEASWMGEWPWVVEFRVEGEPDRIAPPAPVLRKARRKKALLGGAAGIEVEVEPVTEEPVLYVYELSEDGTFEDPLVHRSRYPDAWLGLSGCGTTLLDYDAGARYHLRVAAVDAAGNRSAWVAEEGTVRRGCRVAPGGVGAWALLGVLGLLRRRHSSIAFR